MITKAEIIELIIEANRKFYTQFRIDEVNEVNDEEEVVMNELYGNVADDIISRIK